MILHANQRLDIMSCFENLLHCRKKSST